MDRTELIAKTVKELRLEAERLGVKRLSALKKTELVEAILAARIADKEAPGNAGKKVVAKTENVKPAGKKAEKTSGADVPKKDAAQTPEDPQNDKTGILPAAEARKGTTDVPETKKPDQEPVVEPDSVFIDRGAILPEFVPGTCLFALVRDPGTIFVYWNADFESPDGWILTAYDGAGNVLQSFTTPVRRNGRGYFRVPAARVARVALSNVRGSGQSAFHLESRIKIAEQVGIAQPAPAYDERWVDIQKHSVVYEAPAPGRAPECQEAFARVEQDGVMVTAGGYDRSYDGALMDEKGTVSTSSRFGKLSGTPSSDTLTGSSERIVRR